MYAKFRALVLAAGLLAALSAPLRADEPWLKGPFQASPSDVLRAAAALRSKEDASIHLLYVSHEWVFDAQGGRTLTSREVYEILEDDARDEWGTIEAVWKPWLDEKPRLRARVIRKDGTTQEIDPSTVAEAPLDSSPGVFDDRRRLSAPLPGLEAGAIVETEIVERRVRAFPGGDRASVSFGTSLPRKRMRVSVTVPDGLPFSWRLRGPSDIKQEESRSGNSTTRTWEAGETPPNDDWEYSVPSDVLQSSLVEFGTGVSWGSVADTYRKLVEGRMESVSFGSWAPAAKHPTELLAFVQKEIRYTSIAFGESAIVPQAPKDVVSRRFGDCKDQATLLAGLLRSRGFDAWVALLNAGGGRDLHPEVPALAGFNHAIVYVADANGGPGTWIDPTSPYARWGELPQADRDRWALVCRPGSAELVRTPAAPPDSNREIRTMEVRLSGNGKGSAVESVEYHGSFEQVARSSYDGVDSVALRKRAEEYVKDALAKGTLVRATNTPARDLKAPFRTTTEASKIGFAVSTVMGANVLIGRSVLLDRAPTPAEKKRRFPTVVTPFERRVEYHVVPPSGYVVREMPANGDVVLGPLRITTESAELPDHSVRVRFDIAMAKSRLTPDESAELFQARRDYERLGAIEIGFDSRAEKAVDEGRVRDALADRNEAVRAAPKDADAHQRLAHTLLRIGLGSAAIREAEAATKLDPSSASAWHQLGLALQHDRFGRLRMGAWNLPGSDAALRKAAELEKDDLEYQIDLAIAFEFDEKGTRYADRKRLDEAIALYEKVRKDHPDVALVRENLLAAFLNAGRARDAVRLLESRGEDGKTHALIAAWAMAEGSGAALEKARRSWSDPAARRGAEEKASLLLLLLRKYGLSAEILSEAAKGAPRGDEMASKAEFFRRLKPVEGVEVQSGDAASVVRAFFARLLAGESLERLDALFLKEERGSEFVKEVRTVVLRIQAQFAASGLPQTVARDLSYNSMDFRADGDAASGWRVRMQTSAPGTSSFSLVLRLAAEDGEPRILGVDLEPRPYARHALRLARNGNLDAAARWLDRALDARSALGSGGETEEDRLRGPLLPLFWSRDGAGRARLETLVLASAAEIAPAKIDEKTLADVRAAAAASPDDRKLGMLLVRVLGAAGKYAEAGETAAAWGRREPEALAWPLAEASALLADKRFADGARLMSAKREKAPRNPWVLRGLMAFEASRGEFGKASDLGAEIVALPDVTGSDWNDLAWFRMLAGKNDAETLGHARKGVETTGRNNACLNTLAAVLVEQGRLKEGYDIVLEAMGSVVSDEPVNADWYVLGRILEEYGFPEDARDAYKRVQGDPANASGVAAMSKRRLEALKTRAPR